MPLGYLATIVATIPAWLDMVVNMDELDINPPGGPKFRPQEWKTRRDLLGQFEQLTVYLRLNEEKVPAIYGPSADEGKG